MYDTFFSVTRSTTYKIIEYYPYEVYKFVAQNTICNKYAEPARYRLILLLKKQFENT